MQPSSFSDVIRHQREVRGAKVFCREYPSGRTITFQELDDRVSQCCNLLRELGVDVGDRIAICIENSISFLVLYFACIRLGAGVNPLPHSLSVAEIRKHLEFIGPRLLFLDAKRAAAESYREAGQVFDMGMGQQRFHDAVVCQRAVFEHTSSEEAVACFYYSSGTTSDPKCVMYTNRNMLALIGSLCRGFGFSEETVHLGFLPLGHTAITNYQMLPALYCGASLVLCENFMKVRQRFWQLVATFGVSYVEVVPTILVTLLNTPYAGSEVRANETLKYIGCGSAPLPVDAQLAFQGKYGLPVANLYGLSETGPSHVDDPFREGWRAGSIGRPLDVNECVILREDKTLAGNGEIGEIALRGENVFVGYYKNARAYEAVMHNGFFLTGDLGYQDESGQFYFVDRKKDLIIKGGVNIYPGEVEEVLYQIEGVQSVAVIGFPDPVFGEELVAYVKPKEGAALQEEQLLRFCRGNLQIFKCPKRILFVDEIPMGPSGKLLKKELKRRFTEGHCG